MIKKIRKHFINTENFMKINKNAVYCKKRIEQSIFKF